MLALEWVFELLLANALQKMKDKHKFQNYFQMITDLDCPIHSVWNSLKKYHSPKKLTFEAIILLILGTK